MRGQRVNGLEETRMVLRRERCDVDQLQRRQLRSQLKKLINDAMVPGPSGS